MDKEQSNVNKHMRSAPQREQKTLKSSVSQISNKELWWKGKNRTIGKLLLPLIMAFTLTTQARDFQMSALDISIWLQPDGSMIVQEDREFTFQGSYSEVYRTFPLDGQARFDDFSVYEDGRPYARDESGEPGTFWVVDKRDERELQLFFSARDTTRTFSIRFTARGAVQGYEDAALLYYQLISDEWTKPIHDIRASITPPAGLDPGETAHWVHGSLEATSRITGDGTIEVELGRLPARQYLEIRALYPPGLFEGLPVQSGYIIPPTREEAEALVEEANRLRQEEMERRERRKQRHAAGRPVAMLMSLLIVGFWIWLFRTYRKRPQLSQEAVASSGLPEKDRPALVNYLLNSSFLNGNALVATMFHLAYRGFFKIREEGKEVKVLGFSPKISNNILELDRSFWEENKSSLLPYEAILMEFFFERLLGKVDRLPMRKLSQHRHKTHGFFSKWKKAVAGEAKKKEWFDQGSKRGRNIGLIAGFLSFLLMIGLSAVLGPWLLLPAGVALAALLASFFIYQRTEEGELRYRQWKSLKQYLRRHQFESRMQDLEAETVNEYLIYGLALGLGPKYFKRLSRSMESAGHTHYIPWIILYQSSMGDFSKTINQVITSTGSAMSSATGAGGGGTMGGGGGAASGGGGAR